jgi:hypothetical protein
LTKQQLIVFSVVADVLDVLVIGQVPGLSWFIDIPVILMHLAYAGSRGWTTLIELVPVVGTLPLFTIAAMSHPAKE